MWGRELVQPPDTRSEGYMGTLPFLTDAFISGQDRTCVPLVTADAVRGFSKTLAEEARRISGYCFSVEIQHYELTDAPDAGRVLE